MFSLAERSGAGQHGGLLEPYSGVAYFGVWASETAADYGTRDAVAILTAAVKRCRDKDMRQDRETADALAYLIEQRHGKRAAQFRKALSLPDPMERRQATAKAVNAIITSRENCQPAYLPSQQSSARAR